MNCWASSALGTLLLLGWQPGEGEAKTQGHFVCNLLSFHLPWGATHRTPWWPLSTSKMLGTASFTS